MIENSTGITIGALSLFLTGGVAVYVYLQRQITLASAEFFAFRLDVAQNYVRKNEQAAAENRVIAAIDKLDGKFEKITARVDFVGSSVIRVETALQIRNSQHDSGQVLANAS